MQLPRTLWSVPLRRWVVLVGLLAVAVLADRIRQSGLPAEVTGTPRLVDGDSFRLGVHEVRLVGIDAPEGRQTCTRQGASWDCGEAARRELARLVVGAVISCSVEERDEHGRLLAVCRAGGRDLNREMVALGLAVAYGRYRDAEQEARGANRGLWAGEFERPRDWRRRQSGGE